MRRGKCTLKVIVNLFVILKQSEESNANIIKRCNTYNFDYLYVIVLKHVYFIILFSLIVLH